MGTPTDAFDYPKWMGPYPRINSPWPTEEDAELLRGWNKVGLTVHELAKKHGRAAGGIGSRLGKLLHKDWSEIVTADNVRTQYRTNVRDNVLQPVNLISLRDMVTFLVDQQAAIQQSIDEINRRIDAMSE